jgi:hypothetical protein
MKKNEIVPLYVFILHKIKQIQLSFNNNYSFGKLQIYQLKNINDHSERNTERLEYLRYMQNERNKEEGTGYQCYHMMGATEFPNILFSRKEWHLLPLR